MSLMHCPHDHRKTGIALVPSVYQGREGTCCFGPARRLVVVRKCVACGQSVVGGAS